MTEPLRPRPPRTPPWPGGGTHLRSSPRLTPVLLLLALLAVPAAADQLHLTNGDRISGTVLHMVGGRLLVATDWGGEISVDWTSVERLRSDGELEVELADGTRLVGPAVEAATGSLAIATTPEEAPIELPLERVAAVNPTSPPPVEFDGQVALGLLTSRGNTDIESLFAEGELVARTETGRYTVGATVNEAEEEGETTAAHATGHLSYDRFLGPHWYLSSNLRLTEDEFRDLSLRTAAGLASGYQLWEEPPSSLAFELGLSVVDEDFTGAPDDRFVAGRWSVDLEVPLGAPAVRLFHRQVGLVDLEEGGEVVLLAQAGFRFTLLERLVASARFELDHDSDPAPGREESDTTFWVNLGYEW